MDIQQSLISDCIRRDRRAEYELYKLTFSYLMSICIRYTRNEDRAREVLNTGFLRIILNLGTYKSDMPFKAWIRRVMINTLINEYKKEKIHYNKMEYVEEYFDNDQYADINDALRKIDSEEVYAYIAALPPATQQVFNLYYVDGYKHREIAEMLEISEGTSKWHLNSAKEKLKEMFKKKGLLKNPVQHEQ